MDKVETLPPQLTGLRAAVPGALISATAVVVAYGVHGLLPGMPVLTVAIILGLLVGQVGPLSSHLDRRFKPGLAVAARRFLRIGIVLLGLKLSFQAIAALGWSTIALVFALVLASFVLTWIVGKLARLPGQQALMIASGFSICGVSAIGAMAATTRAQERDTSLPIALVTLFGSLGILLMPLLAPALGLAGADFGTWVGASLHDVGQVVAASQIGGSAALAAAVAIKLTRVLTLAPMVAMASLIVRQRTTPPQAARPPVLPLFVAGFIGVVGVNSLLPVPGWVHAAGDVAQTLLFAAALFAIGTTIRLTRIARVGLRGILVGAISCVIIGAMALLIVTMH